MYFCTIMWQLIRVIYKKDLQPVHEALLASGFRFHWLTDLFEQYHTQPAIANSLEVHLPDTFLIEGEWEEVKTLISSLPFSWRRLQKKYNGTGLIQLTEKEFNHFLFFLQTPAEYATQCIKELPQPELLKAIAIRYGPLQGLIGHQLVGNAPKGKRFYFTALHFLHFEIRIPKTDFKRSKKEEKIQVSYLLDDKEPHWYLLSTHKSAYLYKQLGDTLNIITGPSEQPLADEYPILTELSLPHSEETLHVARVLYQAIYRRTNSDGTIDEINLLPNYYFFRTVRYDLETFRARSFDSRISILRKPNLQPIIIPDKQMSIFMQFIQSHSQETEVLYEDLKEGDTAHISLGIEEENRMEGVVQVVTKKHLLLISENGFKIQAVRGNYRKKK